MANESAIIIPIPEVEAIVGPLRLKYDPVAKLGVPAHVTVLYPFYPPQALDHELPAMAEIFSSIEAFAFSFTEVRRFPATAYLYPDKPNVFVKITTIVTNRWPRCKPYGGAYSKIIPHLTIGDQVDAETLQAVEDTVRPQLPIRCVAKEVWLMASDDGGMWKKKAVFSMPVKRKAR
jgi:hypothetical protein